MTWLSNTNEKYYIIGCSDGVPYVTRYSTKQDVLDAITGDGVDCDFGDASKIRFIDNLNNIDGLGEYDLVVIKAEVIIPKPVSVVKEWVIE